MICKPGMVFMFSNGWKKFFLKNYILWCENEMKFRFQCPYMKFIGPEPPSLAPQCLCCFDKAEAEMRSWDRNPKMFVIWPFTENVCWSRKSEYEMGQPSQASINLWKSRADSLHDLGAVKILGPKYSHLQNAHFSLSKF